MFYVKHKEITRGFNFSKVIHNDDLPGYIKHYVYEDEFILSAYKTSRDHGVFTDRKIILFDNYSKFGIRKQIFTIPYKSISTISTVFDSKNAELHLLLDSGYPINLKFINMAAEDKVRLRYLYSYISRFINKQKPIEKELEKLIQNDITFH